MNHTARIGALIGAVAMSVGMGVALATPALAHSGTKAATASPVRGFFEPGAKIPGNIFRPGAKLTIKRNADYARSLSATAAQPQGRIDAGENCGTEVIQKTSGSGKTTLVLSVSQEKSVQLNGALGFEKGLISAQVGFSVTNTYKVTNETRYEVPAGKFGTIEAYTLFHHYRVTVLGRPVEVYKPVGVCFNQWLG